ncbi:MAG: sugar-binding domain-containing protein [bacterium]
MKLPAAKWKALAISAGLILLSTFNGYGQSPATRRAALSPKSFLKKAWTIQSSAIIKESGDALSDNSFRPAGKWYPAQMPSTVVAALVENKVYPDPFFGMNLRLMPGCKYPIGANFSNLPMPGDSPFNNSWWYRTQFRVPATYRRREVWLNFEGINFRANVWLNGKRIAGSDEIAGTFRTHELNISEVARAGELNTLAVEIFPQQIDDLAWTWVDWNPMPPDKNMGIFRDVYLTASGPVAIRYPQVVTHFDSASLETARLTVNAEARNATDHEVEGIVNGRIEEVRFSQPVKLGPGETKQITFTSEDFPQLAMQHPRIWWPIHQGPQNLYNVEIDFETQGRISDRQNARFGIREITSELDEQKHRVFKVNGKNVLVRGGGWASDMFLRFDPKRLRSEFEYVKDMNLNAIRLEGQLQPDYFFDLADEQGILIMAGWCCCSHWEHWKHRTGDYEKGPVWDKEDYEIAARSQADQIRRLRNHPSLLVWLNGSDNPPPADVEQMYVDILKKHQWPNPYLSSATAKKAEFSGVTGVKMEGPYEWVPPVYWLLDKQAGGAHAFATEISPGPAVPPIESLRRMVPKEKLWPINDFWNYHAGGGAFKNLEVFTQALNARYGPATSAEDYAMKSQLMTYEGQRAMFEAYGSNRYGSTGVIQWMLNNAWPSMIWHLYDYFLMPGGGYFGTKKACEPVHVQYSYDDKSIVVVNTKYQPLQGMKLTAQVYDIGFAEKFAKTISIDVPADSNLKALVLPQIPDLSSTYFLRLGLENADGQTVSSNFYWLSTKDDVLDPQKSKWYYTPVSSYADMTQLQKLPVVKLSVSSSSGRRGGMETANVTVSNPSDGLAFFVRLQIKAGRYGEDILPIVWQDNYFSLGPGERKEISATYNLKDAEKAAPFLAVGGWNISPVQIPLTSARKQTRRE